MKYLNMYFVEIVGKNNFEIKTWSQAIKKIRKDNIVLLGKTKGKNEWLISGVDNPNGQTLSYTLCRDNVPNLKIMLLHSYIAGKDQLNKWYTDGKKDTNERIKENNLQKDELKRLLKTLEDE